MTKTVTHKSTKYFADCLRSYYTPQGRTLSGSDISLGCDGFANRFAKPSRTVAKRSHGIAKSSHASRTGRQSFKHVIHCTFLCDKPSPSHRICREPVANPSPTLRRHSQTHRKEVSAICTMRQIYDINKTISRLNCDK